MTTIQSVVLSSESHMEHPEAYEEDEGRRMEVITPEECVDVDFSCFESRLVDPNINTDQVKRVILMDKSVYNYALNADKTTRQNFTNALEGLKPNSVRQTGVKDTVVHRRSIIGAAKTFELLASKFYDSSNNERVILFTPFVGGEVEGKPPLSHQTCLCVTCFLNVLFFLGIINIGVLVWSVTPDAEASLHKTLVDNTE